jgi:hypothetical protein
LTDVSEVRTASIMSVIAIIITLMMEAVSTSQTSISIYRTAQGNIPEVSHLHTRRHDNRKSHMYCVSRNKLRRIQPA